MCEWTDVVRDAVDAGGLVRDETEGGTRLGLGKTRHGEQDCTGEILPAAS